MDSIKRIGTGIALSVLVLSNLFTPFVYAASGDEVSQSSSFSFKMPDWVVSLYAESAPNSYTIVFDGNGNTNTGVTMDTQDMLYDVEEVLSDNKYVKAGYTFTGWSTDSTASVGTYANQQEVSQLVTSGSVTLYAIWEANTNTPYIIQYWFQNAEDDDYVQNGSELGHGTTDTQTTVVAPAFSGFTAKPVQQVNINGGETSIVRVEYDRNNYTVTFNSNGGSSVSPVEARYGKTITSQKPANPSRDGYAFEDWNPSYPVTMPLDGAGLTAQWTANTDTPYTVKHFQENLDGTYPDTPTDTETKAGITDTETQATAKDYDGFTAKSIVQQNINGSGDAVVRIEYTRNSYTGSYVSFGKIIKTSSFKYGEIIERPSQTKDGYTFSGWIGPITMPAEDTTLTADWIANTGTIYTVRHFFQNIENNEYTEDTAKKQTLSGTTDTQTKAEALDIPGFTAQAFDQVNIDGDGNAEVEIYYTRNSYTITFSVGAGSSVYPITAKYGSGLTQPDYPTLRGYQFSGWNPGFPSTMPAENITLVAEWTPRNDTVYWIEYYLIDLDGNFPTTASDSDKTYGTTASKTTATAKTYAGYTPRAFEQETIAADGSTVVRIYYDRNKYTVVYDGNGGSNPESIQLQYGAPIPKDKVTTRVGYTFKEWQGEDTVPASDTTLTAQWTANTDTKYTLRHLLQNANNDEYTQYETEELAGTTDEWATVAAKSYDGFKTPSYTGQKIAANGSTVIDLFYDRKDYTITFDSNGGTSVSSIVARYGSTLTEPTYPTLVGYDFDGWSPTFPSTMPLNGASLTAQWSPSTDTAYTVEHYLQDLDDADNYTLKATDNLEGTTLEDTEAVAKTYSGFAAPTTINQVPIAADGSTNVKLYYTRNSYQVIPEKGTGVEEILGGGMYKYESTATLIATAKTGYTFTGGVMKKNFDVAVPAYPIVVRIHANPNKYVVMYDAGSGKGNMGNQEFTYDLAENLTSNAFSRSGYLFSGWINENGIRYVDEQTVVNLISSGTITLTAEWKESAYVYFMDGDTIVARLELAIGDDIEYPIDPIKSGYEFDGWDGIPDDGKVSEEGLSLTAKWKAVDSTPRAGAGGGRIIDNTDEEHGSADGTGDVEKDVTSTTGDTAASITGTNKMPAVELLDPSGMTKAYGNEEIMDAYQWAYNHDITTLAPLDNAMPDGYVLRGHMAKMVVNYVLNVLGWQLPEEMPSECSWRDADVAWESDEIKDYAIKSCALGLMGIDMKYFYPNMRVTRAQFGTVLSRILYGKKYAGGEPYYRNHLNALKRDGIMTQIGNPETRVELRERVWVMLLRASMK